MVSGFVTSPLDHERICLEDARPISIASKLLMSIKAVSSLLVGLAGLGEDLLVAFQDLRLHGLADVLVRVVAGGALLALLDHELLGLVGRVGGSVGAADAREVDAE